MIVKMSADAKKCFVWTNMIKCSYYKTHLLITHPSSLSLSHLVSQVSLWCVPVEVLVDIRHVAEVGLHQVLIGIHRHWYLLSVSAKQHPAGHVHDL